jgi:hypothetical protein
MSSWMHWLNAAAASPNPSDGATLSITGHDLLVCYLIGSQRRQRVFLVLHPEQLLLVEQHPSMVGVGAVQLRVPLHDQEVGHTH